ncbi:MAG TPA: MipA/OmpV family protein [Allosphingosinicella sp.]|nr:MipA/OmpV family protein [Allosphingosinicella sp.]
MKASTHLLGAAVLALLATAAPAAAQNSDKKNDTSLLIVTIGGGVQLTPEFPGADIGSLKPLPLIDVRKAGTDPSFRTPDQSLGFALLRGEGFRAGPAVRLGERRDEEDAIEGIGDVGRAIEVGAFAETYLTPSFRARGEVRKGFGGHEGLLADLGADMIIGKVTQPLHFSIGPRARFADGRYMRAFFAIDAEQSAATGLPLHDADGGLHSVGALGSMKYRTSSPWGAQGFVRYDRLLGDAADSPLVRSSEGSRNQFQLGLGLTYSFGL